LSPEGPYEEEETMPFKALFIAHAPDADKKKHRSKIDTGRYQLLAVVVRDQNQAVQTAKEFAEQEGVESILLCPGFTHSDVAEIADAVGPRVAVAVARGDGPSSRASAEARARSFGTDR
jgi:hypothetical protein